MDHKPRVVLPTEAQEQTALVRWLDLKGLRFWRTPNETYTKSWSQKAKNKALGVRAGVPDLFVIVDDCVIGVEMKRVKGGIVSPAQKQWIEALNHAGVQTRVCRGYEEAKTFVEETQRLALERRAA